VLIVASLGVTAVWRLALRLTGSAMVAFWTVLLTGLYPIWFAQSHACARGYFCRGVHVVGAGVRATWSERSWAIRKPWAAALWFMAAVLSERNCDCGATDAGGDGWVGWIRAQGPERRRLWGESDVDGREHFAVVRVVCTWHYAKTGFVFGNPEFLRYNAEATMAPLRILAAFGHRILHLTAHMNLFVPSLMTIAANDVEASLGWVRAMSGLGSEAPC